MMINEVRSLIFNWWWFFSMRNCFFCCGCFMRSIGSEVDFWNIWCHQWWFHFDIKWIKSVCHSVNIFCNTCFVFYNCLNTGQCFFFFPVLFFFIHSSSVCNLRLWHCINNYLKWYSYDFHVQTHVKMQTLVNKHIFPNLHF